jgi:hypothetical protein
MPSSRSTPAEYRWKARNCRFLVTPSTEDVIANSLMYLANEYEAAALSIEQNSISSGAIFAMRARPIPVTL